MAILPGGQSGGLMQIDHSALGRPAEPLGHDAGHGEARQPARDLGLMRAFPPREASSFSFREVLYEKRDGVARITINRPQRYNAY